MITAEAPPTSSPPPRTAAARTLILDGIWARPRRWMSLVRRIETQGGKAEVYRYDSSGCVPIDQLGQELADHVRSLNEPVNLAGFSMGGVIVRAAHLADPTLPIRRAALMNSPHSGSWLAYLLPLPGVRQMQPTSPFMRRLRDHRWDVPTLVIWNLFDQMVIPASSTRWACATAEACCGVPVHIWPIFSPALQARVASFLVN